MSVTGAIPVAPTNTEQLRAWDGEEGAFWAAHADRFDRCVAAHHDRLLVAAAIGDRDRVLDIGCGTGQTTRDAARAASRGSAVGVDLSGAMLDHARRRAAAEGLTNISFIQADAQIHPFEPASFDIAISRTGAMFFGDLPAAFANIARGLVPSGRLVLLAWQGLAGNEWLREISHALAAGRARSTPRADTAGPFSLADPDRVVEILTSAGFDDVTLDDLQAPMWFGTDADDAHHFVIGQMGWMLEDLDEGGKARALDDLRTLMAAHGTPDGVVFGSAGWVVTARRG